MKVDYYKSALLHHSKGNWNKAREIYEHILKTNPNNYSVLQNYGPLLSQLKEFALAKNVFEKSLKLNPKDPLLLYNYAKFYHDQKIFDKAIKFYKDSFEIEPKNNFSMYNIGNIHLFNKKFDLAIKAFKTSIKSNPKNFLAFNNLANSYKNIGNFDEAIKYYSESIKINNKNPDVHVNYATQLLMLENFEEGFKEYEWRKKSKTFLDYINYQKLNLKSKVWQGENLENKKLLVITEQGIGDLIQFVRYLYKIKESYNVEIILYLKNKKFSHFLETEKFKIISEEDKIPDHDFHNHLLSLLGIFNKKNQLFYKTVNFFKNNKNIEIKWTKKLEKYKGLKIGINAYTSLQKKNIPFSYFVKLSSIYKANFFLIQKKPSDNDLKEISVRKNIICFPDIDESEKPFLDSIEIIKQMDLVITADTSTAHLSATLGKKTWIILPFLSDWRWFLKKSESNWYKNVKLFRSEEIDNLDTAFKSVEKDLKKAFF